MKNPHNDRGPETRFFIASGLLAVGCGTFAQYGWQPPYIVASAWLSMMAAIAGLHLAIMRTTYTQMTLLRPPTRFHASQAAEGMEQLAKAGLPDGEI